MDDEPPLVELGAPPADDTVLFPPTLELALVDFDPPEAAFEDVEGAPLEVLKIAEPVPVPPDAELFPLPPWLLALL